MPFILVFPRRRGGALSLLALAAILVGSSLPTTLQAQSAAAPAAVAPTPATPPVTNSPWDAPKPWLTDRLYFQTSVYTAHYHPDDDHVNYSALADLSYMLDDKWLGGQWLVGGALFRNSFGQFSQYLYGGLKWRPAEKTPEFYIKVTAGLVHGYTGEFQDKIPLNHYGVAPVIVPSFGYCYQRFCSELVLLGAAAAMLTVGITIP